MAIELTDARIKITDRTDAVVEAIHRSTGEDRSAIMRDVLDKWAAAEIHKASLVQRFVKRSGGVGE